MTDTLVFTLLLAALAIGYVFGRYITARQEQEKRWPQRRYYQGLTHLLNDEPDAAIDSFIEALEVNSDTLETHLALGSLLRKRGETARAIRIHQNLLARPGLPRNHLQLAQYELAMDFYLSGLLDRAESLLKEIIQTGDTNKELRQKALRQLLNVYEDTQEWLAAIDIADQLTSKKFAETPDQWRELQAHYCCELAEDSLSKNSVPEARRLIRNALKYDKTSARASLLQASIELKDNAPAVALAELRKIPRQNPRFATETLPYINQCFEKLDAAKEKGQMLQEIYAEHHNLTVLNQLASVIAEDKGEAAAVDFLLRELQAFPQMEAAGELLKVLAESTDNTPHFSFTTLKRVLEKLTRDSAQYECNNCGFRGEQLHWKCPRCKTWSSIAQR